MTDTPPPAREGAKQEAFNNLMHRVQGLLKAIEGMGEVNPDFIARAQQALESEGEERNRAQAQEAAVAEGLRDAIPDEGQRNQVAGWFILLAMTNGFTPAFRALTTLVKSGGDARTVPQFAPPAAQIPAQVKLPGFAFLFWQSPARGAAIRATAAIGNPHGLGKSLREVITGYTQNAEALSPRGPEAAKVLRFVRRVLTNEALEITIVPGSEDLLGENVPPRGPAALGSEVTVAIADAFRDQIRTLIEKAHPTETSLTYWRATLERVGVTDITPSD